MSAENEPPTMPTSRGEVLPAVPLEEAVSGGATSASRERSKRRERSRGGSEGFSSTSTMARRRLAVGAVVRGGRRWEGGCSLSFGPSSSSVWK
jgi:hypothetical protein